MIKWIATASKLISFILYFSQIIRIDGFSWVFNHLPNVPYKSVVHPLSPNNEFISEKIINQWKSFKTGYWWTNLILNDGSNAISPMPYNLKILNHELHISYPFRVVTSSDIIEGFTSDLIVQSKSKKIISHQVIAFDETSVSIKFASIDSSSYTAHIVQGSPYITIDCNNMDLMLGSDASMTLLQKNTGQINSIHWKSVYVRNQQTWDIFSSKILSLQKNDASSIVFRGIFTGVVRFALSLSEESTNVLKRFANVYPVRGLVFTDSSRGSWTTVDFFWETRTMTGGEYKAQELLMLCLPHHSDILSEMKSNKTNVLPDVYMSMKGMMKGIVGSRMTLRYNLPPILWNEEFGNISYSELDTLTSQLRRDVMIRATAIDSYTFGKQIARHSRIALIASQLKVEDVLKQSLDQTEQDLTPWLKGTNPNAFVYDKTWGGLVTTNGISNIEADYGNGYYNDHHFHYGYFLYAIAVVGKFRPNFIKKHEASIRAIVQDIASHKKGYFPRARHYDWYSGHSWASGLFAMASGKSQESSSESVNAYYGVALIGDVLNDRNIFDFGRLLLASEIRCAQKYWQIDPNHSIYEPIFAAGGVVGVVSEMKVSYSTWFGKHSEYIHGINLIPFTPISSILLSPKWVQVEYPILSQSLDRINPPITDDWKAIVYLDYAIINARDAWNHIHSIAEFDLGNSKSNAYYWIITRQSWNNSITVSKTPSPSEFCFGYPACFYAGSHGSPLACCASFPGCCTGSSSSLECCISPANQSPANQSPANQSPDVSKSCHNEPVCAVAGVNSMPLGCCATSEGCCPGLSCCQQKLNTSKPVSKAQMIHKKLDTLFNKEPSIDIHCHGDMKCAISGNNSTPLSCCSSEEGCCSAADNLLECCNQNESSDPVLIPIASTNGTCFGQPKCATAGSNNTALKCCLSFPGCCPGLTCCLGKFRNGIFICMEVILVLSCFYGIQKLYRRKNYVSIDGGDSNIRRMYCSLCGIVLFVLLVTVVISL